VCRTRLEPLRLSPHLAATYPTSASAPDRATASDCSDLKVSPGGRSPFPLIPGASLLHARCLARSVLVSLPLAVAAFRGCFRSAVCDWTTAVPVHRSMSFAATPTLAARPQRGCDRSFHPVDHVVEWVRRPRSILHDFGVEARFTARTGWTARRTLRGTNNLDRNPIPAVLLEDGREALQYLVTQTPQSATRFTQLGERRL
jgi:hypothetical protein